MHLQISYNQISLQIHKYTNRSLAPNMLCMLLVYLLPLLSQNKPSDIPHPCMQHAYSSLDPRLHFFKGLYEGGYVYI